MSPEVVRELFANLILGNRLSLGWGTTVTVDRFAALFQTASSTPTCEELLQIDAGQLGYADFFRRCKADGILQ